MGPKTKRWRWECPHHWYQLIIFFYLFVWQHCDWSNLKVLVSKEAMFPPKNTVRYWKSWIMTQVSGHFEVLMCCINKVRRGPRSWFYSWEGIELLLHNGAQGRGYVQIKFYVKSRGSKKMPLSVPLSNSPGQWKIKASPWRTGTLNIQGFFWKWRFDSPLQKKNAINSRS